MNTSSDSVAFRKILARNVTLPLVLAGTLSAVFISVILHIVSINHLVLHSNQVIGRAWSTLQTIVDFETGLRGYLVTGKENFLEPYHHSEEVFRPKMAEFLDSVSDNPAQVDRLKAIQSNFNEWQKYASDLIEIRRNNGKYYDVVVSERGKTMMDGMRTQIASFIQAEEQLRDDRTKTSEETIRNTLLIVIILGLLVGGVMAYSSRRQLLSLSKDYEDALEKQAEQNRILRYQEWLQSGQASLAYEIRGEQSVEMLSQKIINFLAHYVEAASAILYVSDEANQIKRSATFAVSEGDLARSGVIKPGQSLVGQAVAENRILKLQDLPKGYLQVNSGLGESAPASVMIVPMFANGTVQAVIEFAFLKIIPPEVEELLNRVSETVALGLRSAQYRVKLQNLLAESQAQAEELQVQQEELKVNNEELEEQSRALKESQTRLENSQVEMEQVNSQLEEQTQAVNEQNRELQQVRINLEQKAHELELSSQYKSQFLANMSHELRTPLNSTLILAQLLSENKNKGLTNEEVDFAKTILGSSNDLLNLINDILDLSKVEAGKIDLQPEKVSVRALLDSLNRTFHPIANAKKVKFQVQIEEGTPDSIETDQQRIEQILKNLISNAVKFTEKGEVKLIVSVNPQAKNKMVFSVTDTGIGISKEQQGVIFDAFRQADGTTNRRYGGTGLGLTISRDLAKLLGGAIEVSSVVGEGSKFELVLPQQYTALNREEPKPRVSTASLSSDFYHQDAPANFTPKKLKPTLLEFEDDRLHLDGAKRILLVVEDDQAFAKILFDLSHEMQFKCLVAISAEDGIEIAETYLPHAVILDINLPDHNGLTVLDHLKENPKTRHIPVHIVSAQDRSYAAFQMGAIGYEVKPVERNTLKQVINKLEAKLTQEFKRVLVVEDNAAQKTAICKLIEDTVVKTTAVDTGAGALAELDKEPFDCLIVDLSLPDMSGYELLEKINSDKRHSHLPVIVYTGREITRQEEEQLKKYTNSIIIKGASSHERLLSEVTLFLHRVESQMPADRQRVLRDFRDREKIFESKQILLVDDDVRNIFALGSALESKGAKVIIARNGKEAVDATKDHPSIDLVLMDIMMPVMDGYQATREIRKDPRFGKLPIIAVTAKAMPDDRRRCIEAGANDYLAKPIDLPKLLSLLRVWMTPRGDFRS